MKYNVLKFSVISVVQQNLSLKDTLLSFFFFTNTTKKLWSLIFIQALLCFLTHFLRYLLVAPLLGQSIPRKRKRKNHQKKQRPCFYNELPQLVPKLGVSAFNIRVGFEIFLEIFIHVCFLWLFPMQNDNNSLKRNNN